MAQLRWGKSVIRRKSLTVTLGPGAQSKGLGGLLDTAMDKMNEMLKFNNIELKFSKADKPINAHIVFDTTTGNGMHGTASLGTSTDGPKEWIDNVKILIPATPRINPKDPKSREAGPPVWLHILVHELIHSIGVEKHTGGDVFSAEVQLFPGKTGADDRMRFDADHPYMPPIIFDSETIQKVKEAWLIPT